MCTVVPPFRWTTLLALWIIYGVSELFELEGRGNDLNKIEPPIIRVSGLVNAWDDLWPGHNSWIHYVSFVVIRSGDYYMFEDDSDDDDIISSENAFSPEDTKASMETSGEDEHRLGPLQVGVTPNLIMTVPSWWERVTLKSELNYNWVRYPWGSLPT